MTHKNKKGHRGYNNERKNIKVDNANTFLEHMLGQRTQYVLQVLSAKPEHF